MNNISSCLVKSTYVAFLVLIVNDHSLHRTRLLRVTWHPNAFFDLHLSTFCSNIVFNQWSYHRYHRQQCLFFRIVSADGCRYRCYVDSGFSDSSVVNEILPYSRVGTSLLPYDQKSSQSIPLSLLPIW